MGIKHQTFLLSSTFIILVLIKSLLTQKLCSIDKIVGIRVGNFCHVNLYNQMDKRFQQKEALLYCQFKNGQFIKGKENIQTLDIVELHSRHLNRSRERCNISNAEECTDICRILVCPFGYFGPPTCQQKCECRVMDYCDVETGQCTNDDCPPGFFNPPLCLHRCRCNDDVTCHPRTGFCPFGCQVGWVGLDCQQRLCGYGYAVPPDCLHECHCLNDSECDVLLGMCKHGCAEGWTGADCSERCGDRRCDQGCYCNNRSCQDPPGKCLCDLGWQGKYCSERSCPFGTFGPPSCMGTCFCENDRFCNPSNGDCMGTPCQRHHHVLDCKGLNCPSGYFDPPDCKQTCYCANRTTCDVHSGFCAKGCKKGWFGSHCNKRLCPAGLYQWPECKYVCHCANILNCNSWSGECERGTCTPGWGGRYCNTSVSSDRYFSPYHFHSSALHIFVPLVIVINLAFFFIQRLFCARGRQNHFTENV